jgi:hypothetical protein
MLERGLLFTERRSLKAKRRLIRLFSHCRGFISRTDETGAKAVGLPSDQSRDL